METAKTDEKLQMFFDGELTPEEEAELRRTLESSPEGMAELRQLQRVREAMQSASRQWTAELDSDALFARIESEIQADLAPTAPERIERRSAERKLPELRVVPGGREKRVWGGVATGLAAAAAIFLAVMAWPEETGKRPAQLARGTEVVQVDFGANAGTVFNVEGGAGQSLAVVWIDEEEVGKP
jgi:anti-sigma factor RsiW